MIAGLFPSTLAEAFFGLKLFLACALVYFIPGYFLWKLLGRSEEKDPLEAIAISAGVSFTLLTILSILTIELETNLTWALAWWLGGSVILGAGCLFKVRRELRTPGRGIAAGQGDLETRWVQWAALTAVALLAYVLYQMGSPIFDTEEIVIARRLFENNTIRFDNLMHRPGAVSTYLYAPFNFSQAMIARLVSADVVLVILKLRFVLTILALAAVYALAKALWEEPAFAAAAVLAAVGLILVDPDAVATQIGILAPFPNRHGVAPGVLLPLCFLFTLRSLRGKGSGFFWVVAPWLALSTAIVHAREGFHFLLWLGGLGLVLLFSRTEGKTRLRFGALFLAVLSLFFLFKLRHQSVVAHTLELQAALRVQIASVWRDLSGSPGRLLFGNMPELVPSPVGNYPFDHFQAFFGKRVLEPAARLFIPAAILAMPLLIFYRRYFWSKALWIGIGLPLAVMAMPLLFLPFCALAGTPDVGDLTAFLSFWALLYGAWLLWTAGKGVGKLWAMGIRKFPWQSKRWAVALMLVLLLAGIVLVWKAAVVGPFIEIFGSIWRKRARLLAWVGIASLVVWGWNRLRRRPVGAAGSSGALARPLVAAGVVLAFLTAVGVSDRKAGPPLLARLKTQRLVISHPDQPVPLLLKYLPSDLSQETVAFIRTRIPPHQVFLYDPRAIDAIPFYANQFIAHAGVPLSTDTDFYSRYPRGTPHPVFNDRLFESALPAAIDFLRAYPVEYLAVNPAYYDRVNEIVAACNGKAAVFDRVFDQERFAIYRVNRLVLEAQVRSGVLRAGR